MEVDAAEETKPSEVEEPVTETKLISPKLEPEQDETISLNDLIRENFKNNLAQLIKEPNFDTKNIWILNESITPIISQQGSINSCGFFKIKYQQPENELQLYSYLLKSHLYWNIDSIYLKKNIINEQTDEEIEKTKNLSINILKSLRDSCEMTPSITKIINASSNQLSKNHVHTYYAMNSEGHISIPLVVFPKTVATVHNSSGTSSSNSSLSNFPIHPSYEIEQIDPKDKILNTVCLEETQAGEMNDLSMFIRWLKKFVISEREQAPAAASSNPPIILLVNSFLCIFILNNFIMEKHEDLLNLCQSYNVHILFYPLENTSDFINQSIYNKFKDEWKGFMLQYAIRTNPHTQLGFLQILKQTLRRIDPNFTEIFEKINKLYQLDLKIEETTKETTDSTKTEEYYDEEGGGNTTISTSVNTQNNNQNPSVFNPPIKFTEEEVNEYIDWIDEMSKIGSICIKFTFLREIMIKQKVQLKNKEIIASEKKWLDLTKKNSTKFKYKYSCGLSENDYLLRWFDIDFWRMSYYNYVKTECKIEQADYLWTFDIIQFPFVQSNGILRAPERDYEKRPRNTKPRISVIFAFNAAGDYLQPFFVYPLNFMSSPDDTCNPKSECYSPNGYVNCRIFETWLNNAFLPYLREKEMNQSQKKEIEDAPNQNYVLLYCGKLAVVDPQVLKLCKQKENRLNLFAFTHENLMPFNLLFQKNLRKRQTDLFLDSWRKVTTKLNLAYHFKCKSKQEFFNLFMDAFQNCIEEIGTANTNGTDKLNTSNSAVEDFKNKMSNSFEMCQLWPISDEVYKQFISNAQSKLPSMTGQQKAETDTDDLDVDDQDDNENEEEEDDDDETDQVFYEEDEDEENQPPEEDELDDDFNPTSSKRPRLSINGKSEPIVAQNKSPLKNVNPNINTNSNKPGKRGRKPVDSWSSQASAAPSEETPKPKETTLADIINSNTDFQSSIRGMILDELNTMVQKATSQQPIAMETESESKVENKEDLLKELIEDLLSIFTNRSMFQFDRDTLMDRLNNLSKTSKSKQEILGDFLRLNDDSDGESSPQSASNSSSSSSSSSSSTIKDVCDVLCRFYTKKIHTVK